MSQRHTDVETRTNVKNQVPCTNTELNFCDHCAWRCPGILNLYVPSYRMQIPGYCVAQGYSDYNMEKAKRRCYVLHVVWASYILRHVEGQIPLWNTCFTPIFLFICFPSLLMCIHYHPPSQAYSKCKISYHLWQSIWWYFKWYSSTDKTPIIQLFWPTCQ